MPLGYKWVTKNRGFAVNQLLFGTHRHTKNHISSKLVTVVSSAISASVNSYTSGLLKIRSKTNRGVPKLFSSVIVRLSPTTNLSLKIAPLRVLLVSAVYYTLLFQRSSPLRWQVVYPHLKWQKSL